MATHMQNGDYSIMVPSCNEDQKAVDCLVECSEIVRWYLGKDLYSYIIEVHYNLKIKFHRQYKVTV